jgi:GT2 family glycosyltransferase
VRDTHLLTWGLVVSTYNREKILPLCLKLAVQQTRQPIEIIVIDASNTWQDTRRTVMAEIASTSPTIRWVYAAAEQRSLTLQRNQGLKLATADIVFLIDDDSLMYPDCAEAIMQVYEADLDGAIAGVQAEAVNVPPALEGEITDARKQGGLKSKPKATSWGGMQTIQRWLWRHIFLMDARKLFVPYDAGFPDRPLPENVAKLNIWRTELFQGYRMTYRRELIMKEGFEPLLRYYAAGEDLDASYRVSRHGILLTALDGKLHHFESAGGRMPRFKVSTLSALNQALCIRKHSKNLVQRKQAYYWLMLRRIVAEFFKDILSRRWGLPQMRGVLVALGYAPKIFSLPDHEVAEWYVQFQQKFLREV